LVEPLPVVLEVGVGLPVVKRVVVFDPDPVPAPPVGAGPEPVTAELPMPLPAPPDGESPPPDEARGVVGAAVDADEAGELGELPVAVALADGVLALEETASQERSKYGVVLKGLPGTIPKLGLV